MGGNHDRGRYGEAGGHNRLDYHMGSIQTSVSGIHSHTIDHQGNHSHTIYASADQETRPINVSVMYVIKAFPKPA